MKNQTVVTQENFDKTLAAVKAGSYCFVIKAMKTIIIDSKTITKFEKAGYNVIDKDSDGQGFRVMQGKRRNYVFAGQLILVEI